MGKTLVALLVALVAFTLIVSSISFVLAQEYTVPKPSIPEFTLKYFDDSYDYYVPPVTSNSTDPYTGKVTITTKPGYTQHVDNRSIEISIKNQPYNFSYNGTKYFLYYNVRVKGHFGENWEEIYESHSRFECPYPRPSESEYTVLHIWANEYASGYMLDFQVTALVGYYAVEWIPRYIQGPYGDYKSVFHIGQSSNWSLSQTLAIPESSPSPTNSLAPIPTLAPTPTLPPSASPSLTPIVTSTQNTSPTPNISTSNSPNPTPSAPELTTNTAIAAIAATSCIILVLALIFKKKN